MSRIFHSLLNCQKYLYYILTDLQYILSEIFFIVLTDWDYILTEIFSLYFHRFSLNFVGSIYNLQTEVCRVYFDNAFEKSKPHYILKN